MKKLTENQIKSLETVEKLVHELQGWDQHEYWYDLKKWIKELYPQVDDINE